MFSKPTFFKTLSFCVLGICAATLITFSQTSDTAMTQNEAAATPANLMPIARTLTSADGRTIDVVIVSKTETAIKAKRSDGKEFEINLDKLSDADKAFVAGLVTPDPLAPPVTKKLSVIIMVNDGDFARDKPLHDWLIQSGFDVTVGFLNMPDGKDLPVPKDFTVEPWEKRLARLKVAKTITDEKVVCIARETDTDPYDIVWINTFKYGKNSYYSTDHYAICNHRNTIGKTVVVPTQKARAHKKLFVSTEAYYSVNKTSAGAGRYNEDDDSFVKTQDNWVFYDRSINDRTKEKLLREVAENVAQ